MCFYYNRKSTLYIRKGYIYWKIWYSICSCEMTISQTMSYIFIDDCAVWNFTEIRGSTSHKYQSQTIFNKLRILCTLITNYIVFQCAKNDNAWNLTMNMFIVHSQYRPISRIVAMLICNKFGTFLHIWICKTTGISAVSVLSSDVSECWNTF